MDSRRVFLSRDRRRARPRRRPGVARTWPGVLVACLLLAGSSAATTTDPPLAPTQRAEPSLAALHQLPPVYRMTYTWTEAGERIQTAEYQLIGECMARNGFAYPAPPPTSTASGEALWPFPFGLESLTQDGPAQTAPQPSETPRGEDFDEALFGDPEQRVTARGAELEVSRPATGCLAEADQRLLGDGRVRWMELTIQLFEAQQAARERLDQDPAFLNLTARWQRCMHQAGFPVRDPREVMALLPADAELTAEPAAVADIQCKRDTDFLADAYAALARHQQDLLDHDPSLARDWAALHERQDGVAQTVLGS
jgi:hypothetical protein